MNVRWEVLITNVVPSCAQEKAPSDHRDTNAWGHFFGDTPRVARFGDSGRSDSSDFIDKAASQLRHYFIIRSYLGARDTDRSLEQRAGSADVIVKDWPRTP